MDHVEQESICDQMPIDLLKDIERVQQEATGTKRVRPNKEPGSVPLWIWIPYRERSRRDIGAILMVVNNILRDNRPIVFPIHDASRL